MCIRIETYESKESEKMVRSLLGGRFANTAFCIFDHQGKQRLSRSGRSPGSLVGRQSEGGDESIIKELNRISSRYQSSGESGPALLQDFDTFRQALNVASADQRLLVVVTSDNEATRQTLRKALSNDENVGIFHVDIVDGKPDDNWAKAIEGERREPGILIVRSGQFGLQGNVMRHLPESASLEEIRDALRESNQEFASTEKRKDYDDHVAAGLRKGIFFENEIPYGEDRNADGIIDNQQRRRRGR